VNREYTAKELRKLLDRAKKEIKKHKQTIAQLEEELSLVKSGGSVSSDGTGSGSVNLDMSQLSSFQELRSVDLLFL